MNWKVLCNCEVYINIIHLGVSFLCWILNISPILLYGRCLCALVIAVNGSQLSPVQGHPTSNDDMSGVGVDVQKARPLASRWEHSVAHLMLQRYSWDQAKVPL